MIVLLLLLLAGCSQEPSTTLFNGNAMTIDYRIIIGAPLSAKKRIAVEQKIQGIFDEVNAHYNKFNPNSELSHLNSMKAGTIAPLSQKLEALLIQTDAIVRLTEGKFDPAIEPLQQLWKSRLEAGVEPTQAEIEALKPALGWDKIHIKHSTFYKDHDLTRLDLGGIAKGYCVDLLVEGLKALGYPNLFVEWGGEVRAAGKHPNNRPWRVFISNLGNSDPNQAIAKVELRDQAIATSGDYMQHWALHDRLYTHIFDPHTYRPLEVTPSSIASASVLASTCTFADGIAKVGMLFPSLSEAEEWAEEMRTQYPETQFWFVTRSND